MREMDTRMQPAIAAKELVKRYGKLTALDRVSFEVGHGELFGMIGPVSYTHLTLPTIYSV